jgi:hypothetical protein
MRGVREQAGGLEPPRRFNGPNLRQSPTLELALQKVIDLCNTRHRLGRDPIDQ